MSASVQCAPYLSWASLTAKRPDCNASSTGVQRSANDTVFFGASTASDFASEMSPTYDRNAAASTMLMRI